MDLMDSYHMNGREFEQVLRYNLGHRYGRIRGDFIPCDLGGNALPPDSAELQNQIQDLLRRAETVFKILPDVQKIRQCRQETD